MLTRNTTISYQTDWTQRLRQFVLIILTKIIVLFRLVHCSTMQLLGDLTANVLKWPINPKVYPKNKDARKLEPQKVQPKIEKPVVSASDQKGQIFTNKPLIGKRTAHAIGAGLAVGRIAVDVAHEYAEWKGEVVTRKAERVHHMVDNQVNSTKEAIREGCHRFDERKMAAEQEIRRLEEMERNQQPQKKTNLIFTCTVALAVFALATSSFSTCNASHKASPIDAAKTNFGQVNQGMKITTWRPAEIRIREVCSILI